MKSLIFHSCVTLYLINMKQISSAFLGNKRGKTGSSINMKILFTISLFVIIPFACLQAQIDEYKVKVAVQNYVDAFYDADTLKIHKSIAKDVVKYGYAIPKNKTAYERFDGSFDEMISSIVKYGKFPDQTKPIIKVFEVLDKTASAKVSAGWGIDYILLAKQNDVWMITHVLWQTYPPEKNNSNTDNCLIL